MSKSVIITDEGKREIVLVDDSGTPASLTEAISTVPFLACLGESDPDEAERIAKQMHRAVKDYLAQKFGKAYLESGDVEALKILYSECIK